MRSALAVLLLALGLGGLAGCATMEARARERADAKEQAWKASNPGQEPTDEQRVAWLDESRQEIQDELAEYGQGFLGSILSGNWLAAIFAAGGAAGLIFGSTKRVAGVKAAKAGGVA